MQQPLKRTRVLIGKIGKMLDLIEQTDDISPAECDLILSYFNDAQRFFKEDVVTLNAAIAQPPATPTVTPQPPITQTTEESILEKGQETFSNFMEKITENVSKVVEQATHKLEENTKPSEASNATPTKKNNWDDLMQSAEQFLDNHSSKLPEKEAEETRYEEVVQLPPIQQETKPTVHTNQPKVTPPNKEDTPLEDDIVPYKEPATKPPLKKVALVSLHSDDDDDAPTANGMNIDELFDINTSENYGSIKPIKDLRLAFGINERLFNINELFSKNAAQYDISLNAINNLSSFAEAKEYITEQIIEQYGWNTPQKQKKAQGFIRYVWRRFL